MGFGKHVTDPTLVVKKLRRRMLYAAEPFTACGA
jgi:hypothetical protein